jgi:hypothetical protein
MEAHMKMMDEVMAQMQKASPARNDAGADARVDRRALKLMNEMMGQMMDEHHMMMQGMSMPGMGKK